MRISVENKRAYGYTGSKTPVAGQRTVVFVHGAGLDHSVWLLQSRYLAHHGHNVSAVDLPGHGQSEGPALTDIQSMADWVVKVLDACAVQRASVVGHSMGALVALETGARAPERVERLALLGASVPMPVSDALLEAARANDRRAHDMINLWGHSRAAQMGGNPVPGLWMSAQTLRLLERSRPGVLHRDLNACNTYQQGLESARRLRCPVLLLLARHDRMTPPKNSEELVRNIPDTQVLLLEECGHEMMSEQPDAVVDALKEFLG